MTERTQSGLITRRTVFSLIGVALPATIFAVSRGAAQTPGMERREDRRDDREERREERRGVVEEPATTGSTAPSTGAGAVEGPTYHGGPKSPD